MGQVEILRLLERKRMPLPARDIAEQLNDRKQKVMNALTKLFEMGDVKCIELDRVQAMKYYKSKRKLRLYYISTLNQSDFIRAKKALPYL